MPGAQQAERVRPADLQLDSATRAPATDRFAALDAWRGLAALAVALYRLEANGAFYGLGFVRNSWLFVDFFFVLSGFVIAFAYLDRIEDGRSTAKFTLRRFGRLWPLHIAMLLAFVALEGVHLIQGEPSFQGAKAPWTLLPELALAHGLGITGLTDWNSPSWSISTEFWTYLVFAALVLGFRRQMALAATIVAVLSLGVLVSVSTTGMDVTFDYGFLRCLAGFFTGVLTLMLWRIVKDRVVLPMPTLLEVATLVVMIGFVTLAGRTALSYAAPFVFGMAVLVFSFQRGALSYMLLTRPMQAIGEWSYAIYMTAYFIALIFNLKIVPRFPYAPMDGIALAYLACVLIASWLAYKIIETPTRAFFNRLAAKL